MKNLLPKFVLVAFFAITSNAAINAQDVIGYITKSDKIEGGDVRAWSMPNYGGWETNFVHEYPKSENNCEKK